MAAHRQHMVNLGTAAGQMISMDLELDMPAEALEPIPPRAAVAPLGHCDVDYKSQEPGLPSHHILTHYRKIWDIR